MLRRLTADDLPSLLIIEHATSPYPWTADIFTRCLDTSSCEAWGFEQAGQLAGYIFFSLKPPGEAHLFNLCVSPSFWRQGIATHLLQYAVSIATKGGATVMYLEVRRSNEAALALYLQQGFSQIGERKNYYQSPHGHREDAITCAMELGLI